jgi:hypothetical protein
MLHQLIPTMPKHRLLPLVEKFAELLEGQPLFADMFGALTAVRSKIKQTQLFGGSVVRRCVGFQRKRRRERQFLATTQVDDGERRPGPLRAQHDR